MYDPSHCEFLVGDALKVATIAHRDQVRKDEFSTPFIYHPVMVMLKVARDTTNPVALATALLHDVVEDTDASIDSFPEEVKEYVEVLTARGEDKRLRKLEAVDDLGNCVSNIPILVKLADRLHNLESTPSKFDMYKESTEELLYLAYARGLFDTFNCQDLRSIFNEIKNRNG